MIICLASDLHGFLCKIPKCEILLIGGDILPDLNVINQAKWLENEFAIWLDNIPAKYIVGIFGNHCIIGQYAPHLIPTDLKWIYLQDSAVEIEGIKIYGSPWSLPIWGVFQANDEELEKKYAKMPDDIDILISHGPAYGIADRLLPTGEHVGSKSLLKRIEEIKPACMLSSHVHECRGHYRHFDTIVINASIQGFRNTHQNPPIMIDFNKETKEIKIL